MNLKIKKVILAITIPVICMAIGGLIISTTWNLFHVTWIKKFTFRLLIALPCILLCRYGIERVVGSFFPILYGARKRKKTTALSGRGIIRIFSWAMTLYVVIYFALGYITVQSKNSDILSTVIIFIVLSTAFCWSLMYLLEKFERK